MSTPTAERAHQIVRRDDPVTSYQAAEQVAPTADTVRGRVLALLIEYGPCTHDRLIAEHKRKAAFDGWPPAGDSSIRTRCSELERDGRAERVPDQRGRSAARNPALLWRAVTV